MIRALKLTRRAFVTSSLALAACATSKKREGGARGPLVIVPGTGGGMALYARLVASLEKSGVHAAALALPGMGERVSELRKDIDVNTHADDVIKQLDALDLTDVTLVGHSYGGMVITGAVQSPRVTRLVYLEIGRASCRERV